MERLRYRSTSTADLQAELRQRDLLDEVDHVERRPMRRVRRPAFRMTLGWWRRGT